MSRTANLDSEENYRWMTTTPVRRLILSLAAPTITTMLVTAFYNMVDTMFVSRLGTSASAAVGVVFSLMAIIQAIGLTFGQGSGNVVARLLGAKERDRANQVFSSAFFSSMTCGLVLAVFGLTFLRPFMRLLGSTETILPYAMDYAGLILIGAPYMAASFTMNNNLRSEGKAVLGMVGMVSGAVVNVVLDPIFIFVLGMGIRGAALATILSQLVSFCILLSQFLSHRSNLHLSIRNVQFQWPLYRDILQVGMPSFLRQSLGSVASICMNIFAGPFGDAAIAAMSIVTRTMQFLNSALIGFGQGFQPVAGFSWGAKKIGRLREAFSFCVRTGVVAFVFLGVVCFVGARLIIRAFIADPVVIEIGTLALRFQCALMPIQAVNVLSGMLFQCTGKGGRSSVIALARQGIFFIPLIAILPKLFGVLGIQLAQPIADVITFCLCMVMTTRYQKILKAMPQE